MEDGEKLISIDLGVVADHEDRMTVLPLGEIIQIMYRHCVEKYSEYIDIRFNHRITNAGQDEQQTKAWVDVEIGKEGEEKCQERMEADYVIGCDGSSSAVRRSLFGREWPGQTWDCRFIVQNVYYDGFEKHGWDGGNYMIDPDHWGLVARRGHGGMWRVTYGDPAVGLTDEEYLQRRPWHFKTILPGHPDPHEYRIEHTNMYYIHNRCVTSMKVGRILLAADAAHVNNPMGGYGCMNACLDVDGLADCFIGYHQRKAREAILDTWAQVRRDIFMKYVDARSIKNLNRVWKADPWSVLDTDKFFGIIKELNEDKQALREFLLVSYHQSMLFVAILIAPQKVSSIEYDFKQHYDREPASNGLTNGAAAYNGTRNEAANEMQVEV